MSHGLARQTNKISNTFPSHQHWPLLIIELHHTILHTNFSLPFLRAFFALPFTCTHTHTHNRILLSRQFFFLMQYNSTMQMVHSLQHFHKMFLFSSRHFVSFLLFVVVIIEIFAVVVVADAAFICTFARCINTNNGNLTLAIVFFMVHIRNNESIHVLID